MTEEPILAAMVPRTLTLDTVPSSAIKGVLARTRVAQEALQWQLISQIGGQASFFATTGPAMKTPTGKPNTHFRAPADQNRIEELCGLMGAIGEQLGLAWVAEQDLQRVRRTAVGRDPRHQVMTQRAWAELVAHFVLGASHSLGNLGVRVLMINGNAARVLTNAYPNANSFAANDDSRTSWLTFNKYLTKDLRKASGRSGNRFMVKLAQQLSVFESSSKFRDLNQRRGLDFHRRQPQSVAHASPPSGSTQELAGGGWEMSLSAPDTDPAADPTVVTTVALNALLSLRDAMHAIRPVVFQAIRGERIFIRTPS